MFKAHRLGRSGARLKSLGGSVNYAKTTSELCRKATEGNESEGAPIISRAGDLTSCVPEAEGETSTGRVVPMVRGK